MLTKADFKELEKKFVTKNEFKNTTTNIVNLIESVANTIITELTGEIREFKAEMREFREEMRAIISNHEHRLDRLEDKVFS